MSKAQYDIYIGKVLDLTRSLVIKSGLDAVTINRELAMAGYVAGDDPTQWKYYLNLNGIPHAADVPMTVTSIDNHQTIEFTKENLHIHLATAKEYRTGGTFFRELVARYPDQKLLIQGMLNPVDIQTAIEAVDGEILHYNADLVEENEHNLIPQLTDWLKRMFMRWEIADYSLIEDLYAAGQLAAFVAAIPMKIINIRLLNCHTRFAHSYHIRNFLASHGRLDQYIDYMTRDQVLWLYRNIRHIERNVGKTDNFEWLVDNLLQARGIPLAAWNLKQNTEFMPEELTPSPVYERVPITTNLIARGVDERSAPFMAERAINSARSNSSRFVETVEEVTQAIAISDKGEFLTKVLESSMIDDTDALPFTLADTLLNHWLYLASKDRYTATVVVENPKAGGYFNFNPKEAFAIFLYALHGSRGSRLPYVPDVWARHVRRPIPPTRSELWGISEPDLIIPELIEKMYTDLAPVGNYLSIEGFSDAMVEVHRNKMYHRDLYVFRQHYITRATAEALVGRFYFDTECHLYDNQPYAEWFASRGLNIPEFNELELGILAESILQTATGAGLRRVKSLKEIQGALLRLLAQLSSYSIQIIQDINTDPIKVADDAQVRLGYPEAEMAFGIEGELPRFHLLSQHARSERLIEGLLEPDPMTVDGESFSSVMMDLDDGMESHSKTTYHYLIDLGPTIITNYGLVEGTLEDTVVVETDHYHQLPVRRPLSEGFNAFNSHHLTLTGQERQEIRDRWNDWASQNIGFRNPELDGLHVPGLPVVELDGLQVNPNLVTELEGLEVTPGLITELDGLAVNPTLVTELNGLTVNPELVTELDGLRVESTLVAELNGLSVSGTLNTELDGLTVPGPTTDLNGLDVP